MKRFDRACGVALILLVLAAFAFRSGPDIPSRNDLEAAAERREGRSQVGASKRRGYGTGTVRARYRAATPSPPVSDRTGGTNGQIIVGGIVGVAAVWVLVRVMLLFFGLGRSVTRDLVHLAGGGSVSTLPQYGVVRPHRERPLERRLRSEDLIVRLCDESGWLLVSQEHDHYVVRSGDPTTQQYVNIRWKPTAHNVLFTCWFPVRFSLERDAPGLNARLMLRSRDLHYAAWKMDIGGSTEACFYVGSSLPASSLDSRVFGFVCQEITWEINAFHAELRSKFAYGGGQVGGDARSAVRQEFRGGLPMRQGDNLPVRRDDNNVTGTWYTN
jgi:hypothetical protein